LQCVAVAATVSQCQAVAQRPTGTAFYGSPNLREPHGPRQRRRIRDGIDVPSRLLVVAAVVEENPNLKFMVLFLRLCLVTAIFLGADFLGEGGERLTEMTSALRVRVCLVKRDGPLRGVDHTIRSHLPAAGISHVWAYGFLLVHGERVIRENATTRAFPPAIVRLSIINDDASHIAA
jgi:hypothetical protein